MSNTVSPAGVRRPLASRRRQARTGSARVGLTGGIACGKSRVRRHLGRRRLPAPRPRRRGPRDDRARRAGLRRRGGGLRARILARDGTVDRKAAGARVFADAAARLSSNVLVHPRVRTKRRAARAAQRRGGAASVVTDAALLVEAWAAPALRPARGRDCEGGSEQLRRLVARDRIEEAARERASTRRCRAARETAVRAHRLRRLRQPGSHGCGGGWLLATSSRRSPNDAPSRPPVREDACGSRSNTASSGPWIDPVRFAAGVVAPGRGDGADQAAPRALPDGPWIGAAPGPGRAGRPGALARRGPLVADPPRPGSGVHGGGDSSPPPT